MTVADDFVITPPMKANLFQTLWVFLRSAGIMIDICSRAVWKSLTKTTSRAWVDQAAHNWAARLVKAARIKVTVFNPHTVDFHAARPMVVMCNHTSLYDIPLSFAAVPGSLRMLAKKELSNVPFMGQGMKAAEFLFVDRNNRKQAFKDMEIVKEKMESGIIVWIAPEGTRSKTGKLGPFKKGAFLTAMDAKALIIPIGIRGANTVMPPKTWQLWLDQPAEVHIGEPIDTAEYSSKTRDELIERVRLSILELSGQA